MKNCENCGKAKTGCFYRGIVNPCSDWRSNPKTKLLKQKAKQCVGKALSMSEGQFITQAVNLVVFSPKQETWLESIFARVC